MNEEFLDKLKGNSGLLSLHKTSEWLESARLLMRITRCDFDGSMFIGDGKVYSEACQKAFMDSDDELLNYLTGGEIYYYEHEKNKKGKLTKCKATTFKPTWMKWMKERNSSADSAGGTDRNGANAATEAAGTATPKRTQLASSVSRQPGIC